MSVRHVSLLSELVHEQRAKLRRFVEQTSDWKVVEDMSDIPGEIGENPSWWWDGGRLEPVGQVLQNF